jgi:hypothetical protein
MSTMTIGYKCQCGSQEEVEINVEHGGESSSYDYPGSGAVWSPVQDIVHCDACENDLTADQFEELYQEHVQQLLAEPDDPEPEWS